VESEGHEASVGDEGLIEFKATLSTALHSLEFAAKRGVWEPLKPAEAQVILAERKKLREALAAYRSALRSGEKESEFMEKLGDEALGL
jgi:hypothetical protein